MPHSPKQLLPVEDVLEALDSTVAALSECAVAFSKRLDEPGEDLPCLYQWHKLEKAARSLLQARLIDDETLSTVSVLSAQKELISRAIALLDCLQVTGGAKSGPAPNLRHPGRKTRKHPWGSEAADD